MATTRQGLHELVDLLPEEELAAADRYLRYLQLLGTDPVLRAIAEAPPDDEPVTEEDLAALAEARADLASGRTVSHEEARRRLLGGR